MIIELLNNDNVPPEDMIIFGVIKGFAEADEQDPKKIIVFDGRTEWVLEVQQNCTIPDIGENALIFCSAQISGEWQVYRILLV